MNKKNIFKYLSLLKKEIHEHNYRYYNLNKPIIDDYTFDMKIKLLEKLESRIRCNDNLSPTNTIGSYLDENLKSFKHLHQMYSLKNLYNQDDLIFWVNNIKKIRNNVSYICEPKYDGVSINLIYKKGCFYRALTRGDGKYGDDVSSNILVIPSIPYKLNNHKSCKYIEFRGEVIISNTNFINLNKLRLKNKHKIYSNPRSIVHGTLRLKNNIQEVISRSLNCFIYNVYFNNEYIFDNHVDSLKYCQDVGFNIPHFYTYCERIENIIEFISSWKIKKKDINYKTDGVVIKVNQLKYQEYLGYTNKYPKWAIAYKFSSKTITTKILNVKYQVSKYGKINPVAIIEPVFLEGTIIEKIFLYNKKYIENILKLYFYDEIFIEKGGEIIPKINSINTHVRSINAIPIKFITTCPSCNNKLVTKNDSVYCLNDDCTDQLISKIVHFVSKKCLDIKYLGVNLIKLMFNENIIKYPYDLYKLNKMKLYNIKNIGNKLITKIIYYVNKSKDRNFYKLLYALCIPNVGEVLSYYLAKKFKNIDNIIHCSYNQLIKFNNIGDQVAIGIITYFRNKKNLNIIKNLKKAGLRLYFVENIIKNNFFLNKKFLLTGKFITFSRNKLKEIIIQSGGFMLNSVNNTLDYLVLGTNPGYNKIKLSKKYNNIKIIFEQDLIKYIQIK